MARKRSSNTPINAKQDAFALEYALNGGNATEAYRVVYGQGKYSDDALMTEASLLRNTPKVDQRIREYQEERRQATIAKKEEAQEVLSDIMRTGPADLFYRDPKTGKAKMRSPQQLHKATARAVKTMNNDNGKVSYTFESKIEAVRELARLNGWYAPNEVNVKSAGSVNGELRIGFNDDEQV